MFYLVVHSNFHFYLLGQCELVDGFEVHPQVVRVEYLELAHTLEFVLLLARYLSDPQQSQLVVVFDQRSSL